MDTSNSIRNTTYSHTKELGGGAYGSVLMVYNEIGDVYAMKKFESVYDNLVIDSSNNYRCIRAESEEEIIHISHDEKEYVICDDEYTTNTSSIDHIMEIPGMETGALREISILRCFSNLLNIDKNFEHPNIITIHDICWYGGDLAMVMPKMCSTLYNMIESGSLSDKQRINISHGLITAVGFLHENNIIHRDIKTDNVLLDDNMNVKLCDFSLAKFFSDKMEEVGITHTSEVGTDTYRAPEQIWENKYSFSADVWSIGVVMIEMFKGLLTVEKDKSAYHYIMDILQSFGNKPLPRLLKLILQKDPNTRITCKEALDSDLFKNFSKPTLKTVVKKTLIYQKPIIAKKKKRKTITAKKIQKLNEYETISKKLDFENPMTSYAAEVYHTRTNQNIVDCVLLASKIYEYHIFDNIEDVSEQYKDFDLRRYIEAERIILIKMNYCLFV